MLSSVQSQFFGSKYNLLEIHLDRDDSGAEFYVDAVHIGKNPTTNDENGMDYILLFFLQNFLLIFFYQWEHLLFFVFF